MTDAYGSFINALVDYHASKGLIQDSERAKRLKTQLANEIVAQVGGAAASRAWIKGFHPTAIEEIEEVSHDYRLDFVEFGRRDSIGNLCAVSAMKHDIWPPIRNLKKDESRPLQWSLPGYAAAFTAFQKDASRKTRHVNFCWLASKEQLDWGHHEMSYLHETGEAKDLGVPRNLRSAAVEFMGYAADPSPWAKRQDRLKALRERLGELCLLAAVPRWAKREIKPKSVEVNAAWQEVLELQAILESGEQGKSRAADAAWICEQAVHNGNLFALDTQFLIAIGVASPHFSNLATASSALDSVRSAALTSAEPDKTNASSWLAATCDAYLNAFRPSAPLTEEDEDARLEQSTAQSIGRLLNGSDSQTAARLSKMFLRNCARDAVGVEKREAVLEHRVYYSLLASGGKAEGLRAENDSLSELLNSNSLDRAEAQVRMRNMCWLITGLERDDSARSLAQAAEALRSSHRKFAELASTTVCEAAGLIGLKWLYWSQLGLTGFDRVDPAAAETLKAIEKTIEVKETAEKVDSATNLHSAKGVRVRIWALAEAAFFAAVNKQMLRKELAEAFDAASDVDLWRGSAAVNSSTERSAGRFEVARAIELLLYGGRADPPATPEARQQKIDAFLSRPETDTILVAKMMSLASERAMDGAVPWLQQEYVFQWYWTKFNQEPYSARWSAWSGPSVWRDFDEETCFRRGVQLGRSDQVKIKYSDWAYGNFFLQWIVEVGLKKASGPDQRERAVRLLKLAAARGSLRAMDQLSRLPVEDLEQPVALACRKRATEWGYYDQQRRPAPATKAPAKK